MKTKLLFIALLVSTFINAQSIEFTSAELTTAEIGSTVKVDYKYTIAADGYIYCAINLLDDWTWTAEVVGVELANAVAGTDVTGSFDLAIPEGTTPTADLTGNLNYKINIELKQTPDQSTWLAGQYPATQINLTASTASVNDDFLNNVKIYPNPAQNNLFIKSENSLNISNIKITNLLGKEVFTSNLIDSKIDVSNLKTGVYILKIQSENASKNIKFIKQ
ncbi:Por secretion system C-terminal sorting domain-containing protein [Polaribacter sp. Hel1_33_78]|uniref:T9SS type A sorting domain-containing protein n=1 Tax=Polaribacter sp. Hel1_33_78 TaxID=1336804 RepID=UPI00087B4D82|nr:T9SS type A sorting domain-containing protein [Polaribacter sp. Hel1_33_78]SDT96292.1 Por secretion system C-terminal sorting domain-containing protein [Polaribacter sp. Hel1_33_78]